ncbi:MAG: hypothetical protein KGI24_01715 [Candidatus Omnitrophica bacterium]|nr:hypothetical protein [Candidatus Omnitrophota bacterium]MDE2213677.1 hypothetical protein [Candidatus Omnitrophota bacterium]MDE2230748.1 hypothetical protein [Candidatus Omnitrophota bacterium]
MNYFIFNDTILFKDDEGVRIIDKRPGCDPIFPSINEAGVCVVDTDVIIAAAVEYPPEKKDSILVRKFKDLYQHEAYVIQDEKIDTNLFQVIGIREQKVREVYSLIPPDKIRTFIPYGIALRNALIHKTVNLNKTIVFIDDWERSRLLTVFDGLKFSRTRTIPNNGEDILPEIKRSQIDFYKKFDGFLDKKATDSVIIVNSRGLVDEISKNKENFQVEYLDARHPAIEGLEINGSLIKYKLPEEEFKKRKEKALKQRVRAVVISLCVVAAGFLYFLFNSLKLEVINHKMKSFQQRSDRLEAQLRILDLETYRSDLKRQKTLNYGVFYLSMLELIPASYTVESFDFHKKDKWEVEMTLFADEQGIFDPVPQVKLLKDAEIEDVFVNGQPGKRLTVSL